jgi:hypothetical protein
VKVRRTALKASIVIVAIFLSTKLALAIGTIHLLCETNGTTYPASLYRMPPGVSSRQEAWSEDAELDIAAEGKSAALNLRGSISFAYKIVSDDSGITTLQFRKDRNGWIWTYRLKQLGQLSETSLTRYEALISANKKEKAKFLVRRGHGYCFGKLVEEQNI